MLLLVSTLCASATKSARSVKIKKIMGQHCFQITEGFLGDLWLKNAVNHSRGGGNKVKKQIKLSRNLGDEILLIAKKQKQNLYNTNFSLTIVCKSRTFMSPYTSSCPP